MTEASPIVVLIRDDLRLDDNPVLHAAAATGRPVVPLFVLDYASDMTRPYGAAQGWWLDRSLRSFRTSLRSIGSDLVLRRGDTDFHLADVVAGTGAGDVWWTRRYGRDGAALAETVRDAAPDAVHRTFDGHILHDPEAVRTGTGKPYRVYTPFRKNLGKGGGPCDPLPAPDRPRMPDAGLPGSDDVDGWRLSPSAPDWAAGFASEWTPGETGAHAALRVFLRERLSGYRVGRDVPGNVATSRISPHLRFGEISARRLWHEARTFAEDVGSPEDDVETFRKEILWRDFNYHLLRDVGSLHDRNVATRFDALAWREAPSELRAWQRGETGYPIVDAGMRQLWATGWMHNRVRMIVGSFLTRHLLIDWREGERWFWDTLVDADPASNSAQWQWIAGTGADAQPFFRIFAPVAQGRRFDPDGTYVRRWVPELSHVPDEFLHAPWEASSSVLEAAGIVLGRDYPHPIVDHAHGRARALAAYAEMRASAL